MTLGSMNLGSFSSTWDIRKEGDDDDDDGANAHAPGMGLLSVCVISSSMSGPTSLPSGRLPVSHSCAETSLRLAPASEPFLHATATATTTLEGGSKCEIACKLMQQPLLGVASNNVTSSARMCEIYLAPPARKTAATHNRDDDEEGDLCYVCTVKGAACGDSRWRVTWQREVPEPCARLVVRLLGLAAPRTYAVLDSLVVGVVHVEPDEAVKSSNGIDGLPALDDDALAALPPALRMLAMGFQQRLAAGGAPPSPQPLSNDESLLTPTPVRFQPSANSTPQKEEEHMAVSSAVAKRLTEAMERLEARVVALESKTLAPAHQATPMDAMIARLEALERRVSEWECKTTVTPS